MVNHLQTQRSVGAEVMIGLLAMIAMGSPCLAQNKQVCSNDVELRLSATQSSQGQLLLAEIHSTKPLQEVKGEWYEHEVLFWKVEEGQEDVRWGLLGVDLEQAAGKSALQVTVVEQSGDRVNCNAVVDVKAGTFATEKLRVSKKFVEPNPAQLKRAEEERQRLRAIFQQTTPDRLWQGGFRLPLDGVNTGGNFGRRRILNGHAGSPHSGVDFPATTGTVVFAAQRGRVVLAEELYFSGNTVVVDHGLGIYTFYGHLSAIGVKVGDVVETGALLGKVGATGRVTGPHLHWGLTVSRARVNPLEIAKLLK
jgi:murein DD-endopeptidase MepM/ murein hydrolase activator NlpD